MLYIASLTTAVDVSWTSRLPGSIVTPIVSDVVACTLPAIRVDARPGTAPRTSMLRTAAVPDTQAISPRLRPLELGGAKRPFTAPLPPCSPTLTVVHSLDNAYILF